MKLLIVTVVNEYEKHILKLFKDSKVERFSGSEIEGFKDSSPLLIHSSWFPVQRSGSDSSMFFSFTEDSKIDRFFDLVEKFNKNIETKNLIHAAVVPIERYIYNVL